MPPPGSDDHAAILPLARVGAGEVETGTGGEGVRRTQPSRPTESVGSWVSTIGPLARLDELDPDYDLDADEGDEDDEELMVGIDDDDEDDEDDDDFDDDGMDGEGNSLSTPSSVRNTFTRTL